jgi:hypothetical protein
MSRSAKRVARDYDWDRLTDRMERVYLRASRRSAALVATA